MGDWRVPALPNKRFELTSEVYDRDFRELWSAIEPLLPEEGEMAIPDVIQEIRMQMQDPRASVRLQALGRIADKVGGHVELRLDHPEAIPLLMDALSDPDRRVQRAAARALRPFVAERPDLMRAILPHYAAHTFDGSFTHAGLLDVRDGTVWVPRFAAAKGHAALLADGNTDRFFKFEFFVPHQAPRRLLSDGNANAAHLLLHFIVDWSYSRQSLVPEWDDRRMQANAREQQGYASAVVAFYDACRLTHDVAVHHLYMQTGKPNVNVLDVQRIGRHKS